MALHNDTASKANAHEVLLNDPEFLRQLVEIALQRFLDAEMTEHLQAAPHERSGARQGYRNGYRSRQLKTRVGTIELAVPMDRDGTFCQRPLRNPRSRPLSPKFHMVNMKHPRQERGC